MKVSRTAFVILFLIFGFAFIFGLDFESGARVFFRIEEPSGMEERCIHNSVSNQNCIDRPVAAFH